MSNRFKNVRPIQFTITIFAFILIIVHLFWPSVIIDSATLLLVVVAVVPWLIPLFKSLELPGGWKFTFQEQDNLEAKAKAIEQAASMPLPAIRWNKVATLFWLGNDLMWIIDMTYRAAPPEQILQGIENVTQYVKDLGFDDKSSPIRDLTIATTIVKSLVGISPTNDNYLSIVQGHYRTVQQYIQTVKWFMDAMAKTQQSDFKKLRVL